MNSWVKMKRPDFVASFVATKDEQWSPSPPLAISSSPVMKVRPVSGFAARASPSWSELMSTALFRVTMSSRSTGRPLNAAPAFAAPSAMPFISSRNSTSYFRKKRASASCRWSFHPRTGSAAFFSTPSLVM